MSRATRAASRAEAVALEAHGDQRVVVRPHRAQLVGVRVEGPVRRRTGCVCPSRTTCRASSAAPPRARHDPAARFPDQRQCPGLDSDRQHRLLVAVQGVGVDALRPPSRTRWLKRSNSLVRLAAQGGGARRVAEMLEDLRHAAPRVVNVALQLAQRLGAPHQACRRGTSRRRRCPSSPCSRSRRWNGSGTPGSRRRRGRRTRRSRRRQASAACACAGRSRSSPAGGAPGGMQRDQPQRGRVGGAVVRRVRDQLEVREFAVAQLVHDLAGLGVAVVVALGRLVGVPAPPACRHAKSG